jgi:DNA-binding response OmpR family regulator
MTTPGDQPNILLVEDNPDLAFGLQRNLEFEGYSVEVAADGRRGLDRAMSGDFDLIVLDLMLPEMDGMTVLHQLRFGEVVVDVASRTVRRRGKDVAVPPREFELLVALAEKSGRRGVAR